MNFKPVSFQHEVACRRPFDVSESDLPPPYNRRWTSAMKAIVAVAIDEGLLNEREACRRYNVSEPELSLWRNMFRSETSPAVVEAKPIRTRRRSYGTVNEAVGGLVDLQV